MALARFGSALYEALQKVVKAPFLTRKTIKELIRDIQRALLRADVNVNLVLELSKRIEKRVSEEEIPPGFSKKDHVIKVVYEELINLLGRKPYRIPLKPGKTNVIMLVGIQGSGKTTSCAKLALFYSKRGFKTAIVCADTYRPAAKEQLEQLVAETGIPVFACKKDPVKETKRILDEIRGKYEVVLIDTAGRHKDEKSLMDEMRSLYAKIKPDHVMLVVDATIGQQAYSQAKAFHEATGIGSIFVAKLDGSAKGGGALSAVASTGAPISFIGTGEKLGDIEEFNPGKFVSRLLGMGDVEALVKRFEEAARISKEKAQRIMKGRMTLEDFYEQLEAVSKMGSLAKVLSLFPGLGYKIPREQLEVAEDKMRKWKCIIQSMTVEERRNPSILNASRIRRIARGAGVTERDVRELIKQYNLMRKMMKSLPKRKLRLLGMRWS